MGRYVEGRPPSAPELHNICVSWAQYNEDAKERRTTWRSMMENELQGWIKAMGVQNIPKEDIAKELNQSIKHVQKNITARTWHEERQP